MTPEFSYFIGAQRLFTGDDLVREVAKMTSQLHRQLDKERQEKESMAGYFYETMTEIQKVLDSDELYDEQRVSAIAEIVTRRG